MCRDTPVRAPDINYRRGCLWETAEAPYRECLGKYLLLEESCAVKISCLATTSSNRWECATLEPGSAESAVEDGGGAFSCFAARPTAAFRKIKGIMKLHPEQRGDTSRSWWSQEPGAPGRVCHSHGCSLWV